MKEKTKNILSIAILPVLLVGIALCIILAINKFKGKEEKETSFKQMIPVEEEKNKPDLNPEFLKNINFSTDFYKYSDYNSFIYHPIGISANVFGNEDVIYIYGSLNSENGYIYAIDLAGGAISPLCSDSECNHETDTCISFLPSSVFGDGMKTFIPYNDKIYVISSDALNNNKLKLAVMNLDGTEKEVVGFLFDSGSISDYVIVDGYLYYTVASSTDYSNYLYRYNLNGNSAAEELYKTENNNMYLHYSEKNNTLYVEIKSDPEETYITINPDTLEQVDVTDSIEYIYDFPYIKGDLILSDLVPTNGNGLYLLFDEGGNFTYDADDKGYILYSIADGSQLTLDLENLEKKIKEELQENFQNGSFGISNCIVDENCVYLYTGTKAYIFDLQWNYKGTLPAYIDYVAFFGDYIIYGNSDGELYMHSKNSLDKASVYIGEIYKQFGKLNCNFKTNLFE